MEVMCSVLIPEWISYISKEQRSKNRRRTGLDQVPDDDSTVISPSNSFLFIIVCYGYNDFVSSNHIKSIQALCAK